MQNRFKQNLDEFLLPYEITSKASPIVENVVANLAGVNKLITDARCDIDGEDLYINMKGVNITEADDITAYLENVCGVAAQEVLANNEDPLEVVYQFRVNAASAEEKLLPAIKEQFATVVEKNPKISEFCKKLSAEEFKVRAIANALIGMVQNDLALREAVVSEAIKAPLQILSDLLIEAAFYVEEHRAHECGEFTTNFQQISAKYKSFISDHPEAFADNVKAAKLIDAMNSFAENLPKRQSPIAQLFSLFGGGGRGGMPGMQMMNFGNLESNSPDNMSVDNSDSSPEASPTPSPLFRR